MNGDNWWNTAVGGGCSKTAKMATTRLTPSGSVHTVTSEMVRHVAPPPAAPPPPPTHCAPWDLEVWGIAGLAELEEVPVHLVELDHAGEDTVNRAGTEAEEAGDDEEASLLHDLGAGRRHQTSN